MEQYILQMKQLDLAAIFISPIELMNYPRLMEIDIIFLDIQTPNMTGIKCLKSLPVAKQVILKAAYANYALEGYELNIVDYLLKPVELPSFVKAVNKTIEHFTL
jgi:two-component SAPR family response regulator